MIRWALAAAVAACATASPAMAQDSNEMIVVTAQKRMAVVQDEEAGGFVGVQGALPYISTIAPADFVIFTVNLETGTRAPDEAQRELERTFTTLAQRVTRTQGVRL